MSLSTLISEIRYHLNDIEGLGFPDPLLKAFIADGLCLIAQLKPDEFTQRRVMPAQIGSIQCVGDCCDQLISIDGQSDACGNIIKGVKHGRKNPPRLFAKPSAKRPATNRQYTVTIRDNAKDSFDVYPPITADDDVYFLLTCKYVPSLDDGSIDACKHHQALLHYVMYRAYSVETESATSRAVAQQEYAYFFQLLGIQRQLANEVSEDAASKPV